MPFPFPELHNKALALIRGQEENLKLTMGVKKTVPRKAINKSTKTRIVFDEKKRKEFLTGFSKRKDERRQKWKDKVDKDLKKEIQKIKEKTKAKVTT